MPFFKPDLPFPGHRYFGLTPEQRADEIASAIANPITAGLVEFDSWRNVMMNDRDSFCPGEVQRAHINDYDALPLGYFSRCRLCGHLSDLPF